MNGANEKPIIISPPSITNRSPNGGPCGIRAGTSGGGGGGVAVVGGASTGGGGGSSKGADSGVIESFSPREQAVVDELFQVGQQRSVLRRRLQQAQERRQIPRISRE